VSAGLVVALALLAASPAGLAGAGPADAGPADAGPADAGPADAGSTEPLPWLRLSSDDASGEEIRHLVLGPSQTLWVGTGQGFAVVEDGRVRRFAPDWNLDIEKVSGIAATAQGVAVATSLGLMWIDDTGPRSSLRQLTFNNTHAVLIHAGRLWFVEQGDKASIGSFAIEPNGRLGAQQKRLAIGIGVRALLPADPQSLMVSDLSDRWRLVDITTGKVQPATRPDQEFMGAASHGEHTAILGSKSVLLFSGSPAARELPLPEQATGALTFDREGLLWVVGEETLMAIDVQGGEVRKAFPIINALSSARSLVFDDFGRLWVGTGNGLLMTDLTRITRVEVEAPPPGSTCDQVLFQREIARSLSASISELLVEEEPVSVSGRQVAWRDGGVVMPEFVDKVHSQAGLWISTSQGIYKIGAAAAPQLVHSIPSKEVSIDQLEVDDVLLSALCRTPPYRSLVEQLNLPAEELITLEVRDTLLELLRRRFPRELPAQLSISASQGMKEILASKDNGILRAEIGSTSAQYAHLQSDGGISTYPIDPAENSSSLQQLIWVPTSNKMLGATHNRFVISDNLENSETERIRFTELLTPDAGQGLDSLALLPPARGAEAPGIQTQMGVWLFDQKSGAFQQLVEVPSNAMTVEFSALGEREPSVETGLVTALVAGTRPQEITVGFTDPINSGLTRLSPDNELTPWPLANGTLLSAKYQSMHRDSRGRLWITDGKQLFFVDERKQSVEAVDLRPLGKSGLTPKVARGYRANSASDTNARMVEPTDSTLWVGGPGGIFAVQYKDGQAKLSWIEPNVPVTALVKGVDTIWAGGADSLRAFSLTGTEQSRHYEQELRKALENASFQVTALQPFPGGLLVATDHGLLRFQDNVWTRVTLPGPQPEGSWKIGSLLRQRSGKLVALQTSDTGTKLFVSEDEGRAFALKLELPLAIYSVLERSPGKLLLGGQHGALIEVSPLFEVKRLNVVNSAALDKHPFPLPKITSACLLAESNLLVGWGHQAWLVKPDGASRLIQQWIPPWFDCAPSATGAFLATEQGLKFFNQSASEEGVSSVKLPGKADASVLGFARQLGDAPDKIPEPIVATSEAFYRFSSDVHEFVQIQKFPQQAPTAGPPLIAETGGTLWMGTSKGLWIMRSLNGSSTGWVRVSDSEGLPGNSLRALAPFGPNAALVSVGAPVRSRMWSTEGSLRTQLALVRLKDPPAPADSPVDIKLIRPGGLSGSIADAKFLESKDAGSKNMLVIGTTQGLDFVSWPSGMDPVTGGDWRTLRREDGTTSDEIAALEWCAKSRELVVGSRTGIAVFELDDSSGTLKPSRKAGRRVNVPDGNIVDLAATPDGLNVWMLTCSEEGCRVSRWIRGERNELTPGERLPMLGSTYLSLRRVGEGSAALRESIRLGPPRGQQAPVLFMEYRRRWYRWPIAEYVQPKLSATDLFLATSLQLKEASLEPRSDHNLPVSYASGGLGPWRSLPFFLPPDLMRASEGHRYLAKLERPGGALIVSTEKAPSPLTVRLLRLGLLGGLFIGALGYGGWRIRHEIRRARSLKMRHIPYIQGESIRDPARFFGRESLLSKLRDGIPTQNFALIGEFRIGKTSIQHQLSAMLESLKDANHCFFTIFVDLQHLGATPDKRFFRLLGAGLIELARKSKVPQSVLDGLWLTKLGPEESYDSFFLVHDVDAVLAALEPLAAGRRPLLVFQIDEIGLMAGLNPDTLVGFRAIFVNRSNVKAVLSGPVLPKNEALAQQSPWWNIFREIEVEPLTPTAARRVILEPAAGLFTFDEDVVETLIARSEGRPLKLQQLCADLLHHKYETGRLGRRIRMRDLRGMLKSKETASVPAVPRG
jgi:ligand-binding sensor domain-containing protein